jgi:hypothetical protein
MGVFSKPCHSSPFFGQSPFRTIRQKCHVHQAYATSPLFLDNLHFDQFVHYFNLGFVHDTFDDLFEMEIV